MRGDELLDKMELIDPAYVEAADTIIKRKKNAWIKWGAAAACFSLVILAGILVFRPNTAPSDALVSFGGITRAYKDVYVMEQESYIIWPWEYKTIAEQYTTITLEGKEYHSRGRSVDASFVGEMIGTFEVLGYDDYTEQNYRMTAKAYQITGISKERIVAVRSGEEFYVFSDGEYIPPVNLGEVLDTYDLAQTLTLNRFTRYEGHTDRGHFKLNDDTYIWVILNTCRNAEFVEDEHWQEKERVCLSFTATSDALGVYKRVFYVTAVRFVP